ncbi:MAG: nucleoside-diphosphate kinase [Candidatus Diapherotrites archaeon CG08_land_8_20_14_0_20_34_12]|nr:MAG: nucleoside-diphosphate kinase [Candidatus Diapherotrites archaeon CG08_land_8_20_14_0_20_34_12]
MEKTLLIIKPDAINRGMMGNIITRIEHKGLIIAGIKMELLKPEKLKKHYAQHEGKSFFDELIKYMSSIPSVLLLIEGREAIAVMRKLVGATDGIRAEPGTIRGDYSLSTQNNLIHASESAEAAQKEIALFFSKDEIYKYKKMGLEWIYSSNENK